MNYERIYNQLIERAKYRIINDDEYYETHHIIPKCLGGKDYKENLINLYPEEHYVAHQLLVKIYPNNTKLIFAAFMMAVSNSKMGRNNKLYGWIKRRRFLEPMPIEIRNKISKTLTGIPGTPWSKEKRELLSVPNSKKANKGKKNGFYGKIHTEETIKILSEKCGKIHMGVPKSKETIDRMIESFTDNRRKMLSEQRTLFNLNQSESHKEATRLSNINRGILKQKKLMSENMNLYTSIFDNIQSNKEIKIISKELDISYQLVWKIKNNFDYFYPIFIGVSKNLSSDSFNNSSNV
jgi:uncharacterized protein YfkK (UPF0435 family)